jgi:hypothetical protein
MREERREEGVGSDGDCGKTGQHVAGLREKLIFSSSMMQECQPNSFGPAGFSGQSRNPCFGDVS